VTQRRERHALVAEKSIEMGDDPGCNILGRVLHRPGPLRSKLALEHVVYVDPAPPPGPPPGAARHLGEEGVSVRRACGWIAREGTGGLGFVFQGDDTQLVVRPRSRPGGDQDGALHGRGRSFRAPAARVLRHEEPVAAEQEELVEAQLRGERVAQEIGGARVRPAGGRDDAELAARSKLLQREEQEVVRVVRLAPVDPVPGGDAAEPVEERLVVRLGHVRRLPDHEVEDLVAAAQAAGDLELLAVERDQAETLVLDQLRAVGTQRRIEVLEASVGRALRAERVDVEHAQREGRRRLARKRERADLAAHDPVHHGREGVLQVSRIVVVDPAFVDDPARRLDEEAARARREVKDPRRRSPVPFDPKDLLGAAEARPVEHEPNDRARREELSQAIAVDLVDIRLVERAEHVRVETPERERRERVQHLDERGCPGPVPRVVVLAAEEPGVPFAAVEEGLAEDALNIP
jgi:hypothetical protein